MSRLIVLGVLAVALASAAAVRADEPAAAAAGPAASAAQLVAAAASAPAAKVQHCYKEYRVGSNLPVTHCETEEDANDPAAKERIRDVQLNIQRSQVSIRPPGGN
ncbi:MAG TPA: hypothetical protein VH328_09520 [Burkholderiaceae bacterium]|jgi:hypothetical protein|nr:hypothetical protein [Burkholderiaceae bacterium]